MLRKHSLAIALGLLAVIGAAEVAHARAVVHFVGSRGSVASACLIGDRTLIEGANYTLCIDNVRGTSVICDDNDSCVGGYNERPSRPAAGPKGGPRGGRLAGPPPSLSEPSSGGASEAPAGSPAGAPTVPTIPDIMIIN